ncbi:RING finger protein 207 isoform X10 [Mustela lutreola]|uniref:RING finger protein 207 isoform X10 n=1 Tax=Mustela lutreola TaxID=9666 RepID=UPI0027977A3B|nr:RING finger protein 207 isoform X10 [Mustela lutreola]
MARRPCIVPTVTWSATSRMQRPHTSATRVGSRCARAAATKRTGHACSRTTTSWLWASAAATCSRSAVSAAHRAGARVSGAGGRDGRSRTGAGLPGALTAAPAAALHAEPYIMFSTDKKSLLCIRCFRDMQGESRAHCVDLESAYMQGCERLEQAVLVSAGGPGTGTEGGGWAPPAGLRPPCSQAVKALQTATREAIELLQAMVEEVRRSAAEEEAAIHALFGSMQDRLAEKKALLLQAVQSQYEEKDKAFKEQLSHLATLLPTLQVHLVICSSFLSLASKAEFLDLGYELMERLQAIVTRPQHLRPAQDSKITSDHHAEFARCLEPLLLLGPRMATGAGAGTSTLAAGSGPKVLMGPSCPSPAGRMLGSLVRKPTPHRSISTKVLLTEGEDTPFSEHCRHYEDSYRRLQAEIQNLKDQVQELHRDLTKHHSLIKAEIMGDLLHKSLQVDAQIASEYASLQGMRAVFQEIWEESYQRVANEQEIYEAQLHDLLQLKQENAYLTTITKQITPYIRSIAKVKERLEPRLQAPADPQSEPPQNTHDDGASGETQARWSPKVFPFRKPRPPWMLVLAWGWPVELTSSVPLGMTRRWSLSCVKDDPEVTFLQWFPLLRGALSLR